MPSVPDKRQILRGVLAHAASGAWVQARDLSRRACEMYPDDPRLRSLAEDLALRCAEEAPVRAPQAPAPPSMAARAWSPPTLAPGPPPAVGEGPEPEAAPAPDSSAALHRAFQEEARRRLERQEVAPPGEAPSGARRVTDVLREATTRHREEDVAGMLETARALAARGLSAEALRLCQGILERDPANEPVRELLRAMRLGRGGD